MSKAQNAAVVQVPMAELSTVMLDCLQEGQEVLLTVTGNSMAPYLRDKRDRVVLVKPADPSALQPGDVPLYRRDNGQLVLHRIVERDDGERCFGYTRRDPSPSAHPGDSVTYTMLGDAQTQLEPHIRPDQIVALATAFIRKGKRVACDSAAYRRRCVRWHKSMPLRVPLVWLWHRCYAVPRRLKQLFSKT